MVAVWTNYIRTVIGCRGKTAHGINLLGVDVVILGDSNHVLAGAKDQFADGGRSGWLCEQAFGFFSVQTELLANKIGNPLGAGEINLLSNRSSRY